MTPDVKTLKAILRAKKRLSRKKFVDELPQSVRNLVFMQPPAPVRRLFEAADCTGFYVATPYEAPTQRYIEFMDLNDLPIALPWFEDRQSPMEFRAYRHGQELEAGPFGVMQPLSSAQAVHPDLLVMPLVAYDDDMQRIGQGGGHYDRYLEAHPGTKTIGLAWSGQEAQNIPVEPHDIPLDMIVTQSSFMMRESDTEEENR